MMAFINNFLHFIVLALAFCACSVQAAPARLFVRDSEAATPTSTISSISETATTTTNVSSNAAQPTSDPTPTIGTLPPSPTSTVVSADNTTSTPDNNLCSLSANRTSHADPQETITLWTAIPNRNDLIEQLKTKPGLRKGDFGDAFYLTDTEESALQFGCHAGRRKKRAVALFEYTWDPSGSSTYVFGRRNRLWKSFTLDKKEEWIRQNDLIAGPAIKRKHIHRGIWHYAIMNEHSLNNLKLETVHGGIRCRDVPKKKLC